MELSKNAKIILSKRYLMRNADGKLIETPELLFRRVALNVAAVDGLHIYRKKIRKIERRTGRDFSQLINTKLIRDLTKDNKEVKAREEEFYNTISNLDFVPNSPTLFNAGRKLQQLAACFVLPVEDSLNSIFKTLHMSALTHQSGGGTGFNFSKLRPRGSRMKSTDGTASGPIAFLKIFDAMTEQVKQGGKRRGANMGILSVHHPDIEEFITCKLSHPMRNFNLSIGMTDEFMEAVIKNGTYFIVDPKTNKKTKRKAVRLFNLICETAWKSGDPGLVFIDEINRKNPLKNTYIEATNPCGEQPLLPFESCNLGSINLAHHVRQKKINWKKLEQTINTGVHFLDNAVDASNYVFKEIKQASRASRKIGLGVMGFADMLFQLEIPYNSDEALRITERLCKFMKSKAIEASERLAKKRRPFPSYKDSIYRWDKRRNACITTISPTGTISIISDVSQSIEPVFALAYSRIALESEKLTKINKYLIKALKKEGLHKKNILSQIKKTGSIQDIKEIPRKLKKIFVTAFDVSPEYHLKMQAIFQKQFSESAVSKTVNLPNSATVQDVKDIYLQAYKLKCKGVTVYRYGSKKEQILNFGTGKKFVK